MEKFIAVSFKVLLAIGAVVALYILGSSIVYESGLFGNSKSVPVSFLIGDDKRDPNYKDKSVKTESPVMFDSLEYNDGVQNQPNATAAVPKASQPVQNEKTEAPAARTQPKKTPAAREETAPAKEPAKRTPQPASGQVATAREPASNETNAIPPVKNASNLRAKFEDLKKRFNYGVDASGVGWYVHKVWDTPELSRNTLICYVNDNGEIYLASHFAGEAPIAHTQARVSAGGNSLTTASVPTSSPNYVEQSRGNNVIETVNYRVSKEIPIIDLIADNANKNVQVTLLGNQNVNFVLGENDKEAVKDCKELSGILATYL